MKNGFIKVKSVSPIIKPAEIDLNTQNIISEIIKASEEKTNIILFPELSVSGFACLDLFFFDEIINKSLEGIKKICIETKELDIISIVGLPLRFCGKLYNVAAVMHHGKILGIIPKTYIPNYMGFSEKRYFASGADLPLDCVINLGEPGNSIPFSAKLIFQSSLISEYSFGVELCEDLWAPIPPCSYTCLAGATIIFNLSASAETIGKSKQRLSYISTLSSRLLCGYVYSNAGYMESASDGIYSGHCIISECGELLSENKAFNEKKGCISEIDVKKINYLRSMNTSFVTNKDNFKYIVFIDKVRDISLTRPIYKNPFLKQKDQISFNTFNDIVNMQSFALANKISFCNYENLDIVPCNDFNDLLTIYCVVKALEITKHNCRVNYFNTSPSQSLMSLIEKYNIAINKNKNIESKTLFIYGFSLSDYIIADIKFENNDNYFLNTSLTKTIVKSCAWYIDQELNLKTKDNKSEYISVDNFNEFMLYYTLKYGFDVNKLYRLVTIAYKEEFDNNAICDMMKQFYLNFFKNIKNFKSLADGPQIGSVSISANHNLKINNDISPRIWLREIDKLYN